MLTWGLVRSNFFLAIETGSSCFPSIRHGIAAVGFESTEAGGAHNRTRTDDLFLTKEVLCRLSYVGAEP